MSDPDVVTWDVDDEDNWLTEWDGATVRDLVRLIREEREENRRLERALQRCEEGHLG